MRYNSGIIYAIKIMKTKGLSDLAESFIIYMNKDKTKRHIERKGEKERVFVWEYQRQTDLEKRREKDSKTERKTQISMLKWIWACLWLLPSSIYIY